jgi:predicted RNase H-like HicB family nuclease
VSEIIFEVREDEADGGYMANALGYGIHTQGETLEELRAMVKDAVNCYFDETMQARRSFCCISCGKKYWPHEAAARPGRTAASEGAGRFGLNGDPADGFPHSRDNPA